MNLGQRLGIIPKAQFEALDNGLMKVTMKSVFSGNVNSMELPITAEQVEQWNTGTLIQNAFPQLTADQREFLLTGAFGNEWDENVVDEE